MLDHITLADMKEINDKLLRCKTVKGGHAMVAAGTFPRHSFQMPGQTGRKQWFVATVEHWFSEQLRLQTENPDWPATRCYKEAVKRAEDFDLKLKQSIFARDREGANNVENSTT